MVRKIFSFLYKETHTLNQAALLLGFFAFLSQVLAFLRDRLLAHIFGAGSDLDIYYAAFRIPDFIFVTAASVVSLSVLIPFIIEKETEGKEALRNLIDSVFSFFGLLIMGVSLLAFFLMPSLSGIIFKGLPTESVSQVIFLSRLLLLSPILLGFSNLFGSITQAYNRFAIYALAPILYNVGIILGIMLLAKQLGVLGVAIGVIAGALFHAVVQMPFAWRIGLFPRPTFRLDPSLIHRIVTVSFPRTLTLSMSSLSLIFLVSLASLMSAGSISVLSFSINLQSVPLSIIGVSYSLAAFPTLSRRFKEKNIAAFSAQMAATARFIIFWALPLSALFIVLRAQLVRVILGSGLFDWEDTRLTAAALALFVFSSVFQCLLLLFVRGFYSAGYTKKPFVLNLLSTSILFLAAWGFVKIFYLSDTFRLFIGALLKVEDLPGTAVLMLPLAYTIGSIVNGIFHWVAFEKEFPGFSKGVIRASFHYLGTSMIMGATAYVGLNMFATYSNTDTLITILSQTAFSAAFALLVGIGLLIALKSRELEEVWSAIKMRFWKTEVIATDPEIV